MRVAITGMGAISCIGLDADATWASMIAGRSGIGPITGVAGPSLSQPIAGQVHGFDATAHFDAKRMALLDRVSAFAVVAAREALRQSGLDPRRDGLAARMAVVIGTGVGGEESHDQQLRRLYGGDGRMHPLAIPRSMVSAPAAT
ncbi:MAG: beta-ketoacyl synthase N-terminal-like domain-containing protein [Pseudomonadota bacterium]